MIRAGAILVSLTIAALGCGERRHHPKPAPSAVSGDVPPTTPMVVTPNSAVPIVEDRPASYELTQPANPTGIDLSKLPAEEDYEERCEREIDAKNARAALRKLERDIGK